MANTHMPARDAQDPVAATFFSWIPEPIFQRLPERLNRDEMRTPMQWDGTANAGFCPPDVRPWLPVNPDHEHRNVAVQEGAADSLLTLYRSLLMLRGESQTLRDGRLELLEGLPANVFGYLRIAAETQDEAGVDVGEKVDSQDADQVGADGAEGADRTGPSRFAVYANMGDQPEIVPRVFGDIRVGWGSAQLEGSLLRLGPDSAAVIALSPAGLGARGATR